LGSSEAGTSARASPGLAVAADIPVVMANSRGPESLTDLVAGLGPLATAGTAEQAAEAGDLVVLSVPLTAYAAIRPAPLHGKTMLDTSNYYPSRDGRIAELDDEKLTTSELVQRHFDGVALVKAFNNILAHHIPQLARPSGASDRSALPIAADDAREDRGVRAHRPARVRHRRRRPAGGELALRAGGLRLHPALPRRSGHARRAHARSTGRTSQNGDAAVRARHGQAGLGGRPRLLIPRGLLDCCLRTQTSAEACFDARPCLNWRAQFRPGPGTRGLRCTGHRVCVQRRVQPARDARWLSQSPLES
jgi:predicted dinucleotide-binding enzyme